MNTSPSAPKFAAHYVAGLRVDDVTEPEVLSAAEFFLCEEGLHRIVTPNVDHVLHAQKDEEFREAVNTSALSIPDGKWLARGARLAGIRLRSGLAGRLLVEPLCALAAKLGKTVYILGSSDEVSQVAAKRLAERIPGLVVVGARGPSMRFGQDAEETERILAELNQLKPDLLFLGVGAPKSEKWVYANRQRIPSRIAVGVGYAFDVLAGRVAECPRWMTNAGIEWAYRLAKEPRRLWRRYLIRDPQFFYLMIKQGLKRQQHADDSQR